jgi:hypothetical protein
LIGRQLEIRQRSAADSPAISTQRQFASTVIRQQFDSDLTATTAAGNIPAARDSFLWEQPHAAPGMELGHGGPMNDSSRTQGGLICIGVVVVGAWFLLAVLQGSYWAIAIPVSIIVFFVLGLTFWIGYTIATIRVEPTDEFDEPASAQANSDTPASTGESHPSSTADPAG